MLAIKTRDAEHVVLGPVLADGSGSPRDMSEGVLLRLFHALECLYPTALLKEGALKWRVKVHISPYLPISPHISGRRAQVAGALARRRLPPPPRVSRVARPRRRALGRLRTALGHSCHRRRRPACRGWQ